MLWISWGNVFTLKKINVEGANIWIDFISFKKYLTGVITTSILVICVQASEIMFIGGLSACNPGWTVEASLGKYLHDSCHSPQRWVR